MEVNVKIHGMNYVISCGSGVQTWKWLSDQAVFRYATAMKLHPESMIVESLVLMETHNNRHLLPWFQIKDYYIPGITVLILLEDFKRTTEPLTNWQIMVRGGPKYMADVDIVIQPTDLPPEAEVVEIFGSFNCWSKPVFLKQDEEKTKWSARVKFPPGGLMMFRFNCMNMEWLSFDYNQEHEQNTGRPTNWIVVGEKVVIKKQVVKKKRRTLSLKLAAKMVKTVAKNQANKYLVKQRMAKRFGKDWSKVVILDVCPDQAVNSQIREKCRDVYVSLLVLFKNYCAHMGSYSTLSKIGWAKFCTECRLQSKGLPKSALMAVFDRVDIEESINADMISQMNSPPNSPTSPARGRAASRRGLITITGKSDRMMERHEFVEALIRIAVLKYPGLPPNLAFTAIYEKYIHTLYEKHDDPDVRDIDARRILKKNEKPLMKAFKKGSRIVSSLVKNQNTVISIDEWVCLIEFMFKCAKLDKGQHLSRRSLLTAFYLSLDHTKEETDDHTLTFPEFKQALLMVAKFIFDKWSERDLDVDLPTKMSEKTAMVVKWISHENILRGRSMTR